MKTTVLLHVIAITFGIVPKQDVVYTRLTWIAWIRFIAELVQHGYVLWKILFWSYFLFTKSVGVMSTTVSRSKGGTRDAPNPLGSKFFQFDAVSGKKWRNNSFHIHLRSWRPNLGEILDPPLTIFWIARNITKCEIIDSGSFFLWFDDGDSLRLQID